MSEPARLHELDKNELRDLSRILRPDLSDEQFEADWQEFVALKRKRQMQ